MSLAKHEAHAVDNDLGGAETLDTAKQVERALKKISVAQLSDLSVCPGLTRGLGGACSTARSTGPFVGTSAAEVDNEDVMGGERRSPLHLSRINNHLARVCSSGAVLSRLCSTSLSHGVTRLLHKATDPLGKTGTKN